MIVAADMGGTFVDVREIFEILTELVRQGPGHVVAYGLGMVTLALFLLSTYWLAKRPLTQKIDRLTEENHELREAKAGVEVKFQGARVENESLRSARQTLTEEVNLLQQTNVKLEAKLESVTSDKQELRSSQQTWTQENIELREAKARLETKLESTCEENETLRQRCRRLTAQNDELHAGSTKLQSALEKTQAEKESLHEKMADLTEQLETCRENEAELERQVSELSEQVQGLADFDGKVWEKPPMAAVPEFRPFGERQVPIIAVVNLKGGVGKTTLTANLGAILSKQEKRVLLVDLDYQGSLTSLCLPPSDIREIRRQEQFADQLFQELSVRPDKLIQCAHRVSRLSGVRLIAADEPLADEENRMMAQWLLNPNDGDVRYILRSYLHSSAVRQQYDYVLIDCPPRFTTACVNAFTVADFLLIPVLLDRTSAEAVPRQLQSLRKLKREVCPDLALLGIVANRTQQRQGQLIQREKAVWESLPGTCENKNSWGEPIYQFSTLIRQHKAFAEAAITNGFAALDRDIEPMFLDFAEEVKARIAKHER